MTEDAKDIINFIYVHDTFDSFYQDIKTRKAVVMSLLNIGELANHLPNYFKDENPSIPWNKMIGMRNLAAHGYHIMDYNIIYDTSKNLIPELLDFLKQILNK